MNSEDGDKSVMVSVLAGIGIGVLVGAIAGLLLAPKAGTETRENLGTTLNDLGARLTDLSQQVTNKVKSAVETGKQAVSDKLAEAASSDGGGSEAGA